jgi:hypothetical protein
MIRIRVITFIIEIKAASEILYCKAFIKTAGVDKN